MRTALRGRGTRHDDSRHDGSRPDDSRPDDIVHEDLRGRSRRPEPAHLTLRTQPHPFG